MYKVKNLLVCMLMDGLTCAAHDAQKCTTVNRALSISALKVALSFTTTIFSMAKSALF